MKKRNLLGILAVLLIGIPLFIFESIATATPYPYPDVDKELEKCYDPDEVVSKTGNEYVMVVTLKEGIHLRANVRTGIVMQVDYFGKGTSDGYCGTYVTDTYSRDKINSEELKNVSTYRGETHYMFGYPDGTSIRITVNDTTQCVTMISKFSKLLSEH